MQQLQIKDNITSLELLEQINFFRSEIENKSKLRHDDLLNVIRNEFEEEISLRKISESKYTNSRGRKYPMFILSLSQAKQVLVRESKYVRRAVIKYIEDLEKQLSPIPQPTFTRLYWNNQVVMTVEMFSNLMNVSKIKINRILVKLGNNDILCGAELQLFKKNNANHKMKCNSLRVITHKTAIEVANILNKSCDLFLKYYTVMEEKFKLPTEQMKIALEQARLLCMSYSQIRDKDIREAIGIQVTTILSNIGLWDKEIDSELDNNTLLGWSKQSIIQNNISGMKLLK
ncbi:MULTISPECIES: hypothetical protein [unclassified Gemella]|uniref:hypothetical protein n=1 Tax=unclassified Gemella TaxID=2624949 RepID=UPI0015D01DB9|nr:MULTISPECIES: hypothetical protein [unclassified Gemella]MBF0709711.1 hypothetical protein [Gemella sp. GL1.1]NYS27055.1 hypothetical protein [Gemella sp. GL1]